MRDRAPASPSSGRPPASAISSGVQWPELNGGSIHSSTATVGEGCTRGGARRHGVDAGPQRGDHLATVRLDAGRVRHQAEAGEHVLETRRLEVHDARRPGQRARGVAHFGVGDRADVAEGLRHEQVGPQRLERRQVERVERLLRLQPLADQRVDLGAGGVVRDQRPRDLRQVA